jgi:hypothetical protein
MLVQDMLTGQLHEVPDRGIAYGGRSAPPDPRLYGLGEVHDGFGNSLGLWFLPKLIGGAISRLTGGGSQPSPPPAPAPAPACPPCPACPTCGATAMPPPYPYPYPPPAYAPRRRRRR